MILNPPLMISARLLPAVEISDSNSKAWLSWDAETGNAYLDGPFEEYVIDDFTPSRLWRDDGTDAASRKCLHALLDFLSACAESRSYATSRGKDPMDGENSDLFPPHVGEWAEQMSEELAMLACELGDEE